jgi:hypothetical protein
VTTRTVFSVTAILTFLLGVAWMTAPAIMLDGWGLPADAATVYMSRRCGGLFLGYTAILWFARAAGASPARHAIATGGFVVTVVMAVLSLMHAAGSANAPAAWIAVAIEVALAAAFGYLLLTEKR